MFEGLSKAKQKWIRSLHLKKKREQEQVYLVEGEKMVLEGLNLPDTEVQLIVVQKGFEDLIPPQFSPLTFTISEQDFPGISEFKTPNKLLAVFSRKTYEPIESGIILVLDGVQDPGNLGTIMRLADWFGIAQIICSNDTVDVYNSKVIQASMGAIFRIPVIYQDLLPFLQKSALPKYGAVLHGTNFKQEQYPENLLLIMGNEGNGIRPEILEIVDNPITIPRLGQAESLNVGTATSILIAEICFQK